MTGICVLASEFRCHISGRCIDLRRHCDRNFDCGSEDRSDEHNC
ncbi:unnamed protein product, partial [Allacma fusca]